MPRTLTQQSGPCLRLLLGSILAWVLLPAAFCQSEGIPDIRVEAREVVVPVFVAVRTPNQDNEVVGLTAKQFHVFEDGVEQRITNVAGEGLLSWFVQDNLSPALLHSEDSCTPRGIWLGPDIPDCPGCIRSTQQSGLHYYSISYVPPASPEGSCHRVKVLVDYRPKATAFSRDRYCKTRGSLFDTLSGTKLATKMEDYVDSDKEGSISVSSQVVSLFGDEGLSMVQIASEFPWKAMNRGWHGDTLYANIGVMGLIYDKRATLVARFGETPCDFRSGRTEWSDCASHCPSCRSHCPPELIQEYILIPNRYVTQVPLSPGNYELKIVVSDGMKFGRLQVPFTVDGFDLSRLEISGIVLCKRFHDVLTEPAQYRRLVSKGVEFVPTADTVFRKGDRMFAYFEISEPSRGNGPDSASVQFQMKVADSKTGELKVDTALRPVESSVPRKPLIGVAQEIAVDKLPAGTYRLEVQASDSAGNHTVWRTASFTVE